MIGWFRSAKRTRAETSKQAPIMSDTDDWIEICAVDDIPLRGSRVIRTAQGDVALFRASETDVFALDDRCPHAGGPLSQGIVHGRAVTCPLHSWVISLETGTALGADQGQVRTFPVRIEQRIVAIRRCDIAAKSTCPRSTEQRACPASA